MIPITTKEGINMAKLKVRRIESGESTLFEFEYNEKKYSFNDNNVYLLSREICGYDYEELNLGIFASVPTTFSYQGVKRTFKFEGIDYRKVSQEELQIELRKRVNEVKQWIEDVDNGKFIEEFTIEI